MDVEVTLWITSTGFPEASWDQTRKTGRITTRAFVLTQWITLERDPLLHGCKKRRLQPRRWLGNGREQTQTQQQHVPRPLPAEPSRKRFNNAPTARTTLQASKALAKILLPEESPALSWSWHPIRYFRSRAYTANATAEMMPTAGRMYSRDRPLLSPFGTLA